MWAVAAASQLAPSKLLVHCRHGRFPETVACESQWVTGNLPWDASRRDAARYADAYARALPAVFFPNWTHGTYAACAELSKTESERMRVVGFAHSDQEHYYRLLTYYEPLIHTFLAPSLEVADRLKELLPGRSSEIHLLTYPIEGPEAFFRKQAEGPLRISFVGRIEEPQKRVSLLLDLAEALFDRKVDFLLRIAGEGPALKDLRGEAERLPYKVRSRVSLPGRLSRSQVEKLLNETDVFVSLSAFEGQSISMLEAMKHGCVPAVTRVSGTKDWIVAGETGCLAEVGDVEGLADQITALNGARDKMLALARRAYDLVKARGSSAAHLAKLESVCAEAWTKAPRAWPTRMSVLPPWEVTLDRKVRRWAKLVRRRLIRR